MDKQTSDQKATAYQDTIDWAIREFFPLRKTRRKSTDLPWMNNAVRRMIRRRKRIYVQDGGRSDRWRELKSKIRRILAERKANYLLTQVADADRAFF